MRRYEEAKRLLPFLLIPGLGALSPLLVIPAITHTYGARGWATIAIGLSLGSAAAIVAEQGWGVWGPQRVAGVSPMEQAQLYRSSVTSRLFATIPLSCAAGAVGAVLHPSDVSTVVGVAVGTAFASLSPAWFFVGRGEAWAILFYEGFPRAGLALLSSFLILDGAPLLTYAAAQMLVPAIALAAVWMRMGSDYFPRRVEWMSAPRVVRQHAPLSLGRAVGVIFTALPVSFVAAISSSHVVAFSATERLARMLLAVLGAIPSRLQSWIGVVPDMRERELRVRRAIRVNGLVGLLFGLAYFVAAPWIAGHVFQGAATVTYGLSALGGALVAGICFSRGLGLALVARGRAVLLTPVALGAAGGFLVSSYPLIATAGAYGALGSLLVAEVCGIFLQWRWLRRSPSRRWGRWVLPPTKDVPSH